MTTAVLNETDVLLGEESIFGEEKSSPENENVFEQIAKHYQSLGYNAVCVHEDEDDFPWDKYLSKETIKYLDTIVLD